MAKQLIHSKEDLLEIIGRIGYRKIDDNYYYLPEKSDAVKYNNLRSAYDDYAFELRIRSDSVFAEKYRVTNKDELEILEEREQEEDGEWDNTPIVSIEALIKIIQVAQSGGPVRIDKL